MVVHVEDNILYQIIPVVSHFVLQRKVFLVVLISLMVGVLFVSGDSFWIDEGNTAFRAMRANLVDWYRQLVNDGGSDAQMPGYMLSIWIWMKIVGHGEWALRASNILWLLIATLSFRKFRFGWLALLFSPFVLYYTSELRPYAMQIAGGCITISSLAGQINESSWRKTLIGLAILSSSSLTGVMWAGGAALYVLLNQPSLLQSRIFWRSSLMACPLFLALAVHYARSLMMGQGPTPLGGSMFVSLGAAAYELIGLMGLGPSKIELRVNPKAINSYLFPVVFGAIALIPSIAIGAWSWVSKSTKRQIIAVTAGLGVPVLFMLVLVVTKDFRLLGRHLAPAAPLVPLCIAQVFTLKQGRLDTLVKAIAAISVIVGLISALELRFAARHRKDDYRGAAAYALSKLKEGRNVMWVANDETAAVYGFPGPYEETAECVLWTSPAPYPGLKGDEIVILSKPDVNDPGSQLCEELNQRGFKILTTFQAFTVFEPPSPSTSPK